MLSVDGKLYCPRRRESPHGATHNIDVGDVWKQGSRGHLVCSWCGSSHPDHVFNAIRDGLTLEPTDKDYKVYIPGGKFYFQHFSNEEQAKFVELMNDQKIVIAFPGHFYVLPYFVKRK